MRNETVPLDFENERDSNSTSWQRADPLRALIEQTAWNHWRVTLPDGEHTHEVRLETDHGAYLGDCRIPTDDGPDKRCPGFAYHDGPCAHLCTIRKAAVVHLRDVQGRPVIVYDIEDVADARADPAVEKVLADGGPQRRRSP